MNRNDIPYTDSIVFAAEYLARTCREYARKIIKDNDLKLSFEEYLILDTVINNPGLIQMEIAKKLFMQRSYLCKLLAKLEEDAYIKREKVIKGKRQVVLSVFITNEGISVYNQMKDSFLGAVLDNKVIDVDKMQVIRTELFAIADRMVKAYNLKL